MKTNICLVLFLVLFTLNFSKSSEVVMRPAEKIEIKKKPEVIKKKGDPDYLHQALLLVGKAIKEKDHYPRSKYIQEAIDILQKNPDNLSKIPGLDCLKKALYNMDRDKHDYAYNNLARASIEIYDKMRFNEIKENN